MKEKDQYFRASAGIVLLNERGQVMAIERKKIPGAWQLPKGGIQTDEEPIDAAKRELSEETPFNASHVQQEGELPEWLAYELPKSARSEKTERGQVQKCCELDSVGRGDLQRRRARALSDDFDPAGMVELDLAGRQWMRLDRPPADPIFRVDVTLGCRGTTTVERACVRFDADDLRRLPFPLIVDGVRFTSGGGPLRRFLPTLGRADAVVRSVSKSLPTWDRARAAGGGRSPCQPTSQSCAAR
jgi:8-oxo-dGTP pyrophosphatase MutT (NUDIX family)